MTLTWIGTLRPTDRPDTMIGEISDSIGSYTITITGTRAPDGRYALAGVGDQCPDWLLLPWEE
jgi:hypothetical protein